MRVLSVIDSSTRASYTRAVFVAHVFVAGVDLLTTGARAECVERLIHATISALARFLGSPECALITA